MVYLTLPMTDQVISHTWMTKIQETIEGNEKRSALFTWPRIKLTNEFHLAEDEKRRFIHAHLYRDIHNIWGIPIVSDESKLTVESTASQNVLTVDDTDNRHFYAGRECVLISPTDWESYEVATISGVDSSTQITLSGTLSNTWAIDTKVYPFYECRVEPEQSRTSKYYKYNTVKIIGKESFESTRTFTYTPTTIDTGIFPVYNSLNLFLYRPLNPITEKYRHPFTMMGEFGKQTYFSTYGDTRAIFDRTFMCDTKTETYDLLDFFDAKQGRLGTFYTPTWMEDIIIDTGFDATDLVLLVKDLYLTEAEIVGRHIYIELKDGSYVCREIVARPTFLSITIDSAIGTTVPTADLTDTLCSFLHEVRFNVDELSLEYITKDITKTKLGFNII